MTEQAVLQDARRYLAMLHKRRGIVLTCVGVSLAIAVLHNYTSRPVYKATTQILIDRDTPNVLPNKELVELVQGGMDYYQTQYQLLRGRTLAERAVERLGLQKSPELATGPMMGPWERVRRLFDAKTDTEAIGRALHKAITDREVEDSLEALLREPLREPARGLGGRREAQLE